MFKKNQKMSSSSSSTVPSMISINTEIVGDIKSEGLIRYDGVLRGNIIANNIVLGSNARIEGKIIANDLTIYGKVEGQVYAKSVSLMASSNVNGEIYKDTISIEAGSKYSGRTMELDPSDLETIPNQEEVRMISYQESEEESES